jgi:hypothetical protein
MHSLHGGQPAMAERAACGIIGAAHALLSTTLRLSLSGPSAVSRHGA